MRLFIDFWFYNSLSHPEEEAQPTSRRVFVTIDGRTRYPRARWIARQMVSDVAGIWM